MTIGPETIRNKQAAKATEGLKHLEAAIDEELENMDGSHGSFTVLWHKSYSDILDHHLYGLSSRYHMAGWPSFKIDRVGDLFRVTYNTSTDQRDYMSSANLDH